MVNNAFIFFLFKYTILQVWWEQNGEILFGSAPLRQMHTFIT